MRFHSVGLLSEVPSRVATAIEQEVLEVPADFLDGLLLLHVAPQWVSVVAIDLNLAEHGEGDIVFAFDELFDFWFAFGFFLSELVARESENRKTLVFVLCVQLYHLSVVGVSDASDRSNTDDKRDLLSFKALRQGRLISIDIDEVNRSHFVIHFLISIITAT